VFVIGSNLVLRLAGRDYHTSVGYLEVKGKGICVKFIGRITWDYTRVRRTYLTQISNVKQ
jgi:hypothetical protein